MAALKPYTTVSASILTPRARLGGFEMTIRIFFKSCIGSRFVQQVNINNKQQAKIAGKGNDKIFKVLPVRSWVR